MVALHKIDKVIEALGPFLHLRSFLVSHTRFAAPAQLALKKIWTRSRNTADNTRWGRRAMEGRGEGRGRIGRGKSTVFAGKNGHGHRHATCKSYVSKTAKSMPCPCYAEACLPSSATSLAFEFRSFVPHCRWTFHTRLLFE